MSERVLGGGVKGKQAQYDVSARERENTKKEEREGGRERRGLNIIIAARWLMCEVRSEG